MVETAAVRERERERERERDREREREREMVKAEKSEKWGRVEGID